MDAASFLESGLIDSTGILELVRHQGLGERQVEAYPRTLRGPLTFGIVNGRRIIDASRKLLFRIFFRFPRTCFAYPPDETWGGPCRR